MSFYWSVTRCVECSENSPAPSPGSGPAAAQKSASELSVTSSLRNRDVSHVREAEPALQAVIGQQGEYSTVIGGWGSLLASSGVLEFVGIQRSRSERETGVGWQHF